MEYTKLSPTDVDAGMKNARPIIPSSGRRTPPASTGSPAGGDAPGPQPADDLLWDQPIPLDAAAAPPPFPVGAITPEPARAFLEALAVSYCVPVDLAALSYLALAGGCLAYSGGVRRMIRADDDWIEPLNLYAIVALPSGSRKSSVFAELVGPVLEVERELQELERPRVEAIKSERVIEEKKLRRAQERAAGGDAGAPQEAAEIAERLAAEAEPVLPRLLVDDITPEKLTTMLCQQAGRIILASAECDLIGTMRGRYADKGGVNLSAYLKAHAGDEIMVDRVGRPSERVKAPALTMVVSAQVGALAQMLNDPVLRDRGVTSRWLYAVPPSPLGTRSMNPPPVRPHLRDAYREMMREALHWQCGPPGPPQSVVSVGSGGPGGPDSTSEVRWLRLDDEAAAALLELRQEVELSMGADGRFREHTGWASKLPGQVVRIAGIMTLMDHGDRTLINGMVMKNAVKIGRWAMAHALIAFGLAGLEPSIERAKLVLAWLERKGPMTVTVREVFQALKGSRHQLIRLTEDVVEAVQVLVDHGWLIALDDQERATGRPGRKPSAAYAVHPILRRSGPET